MENVNISKIDLENGNCYYLIEEYTNEEFNRDLNYINNSKFKIKTVKNTLGTCTIMLMESGICVGYISASIFADNTASLTTGLITSDMLPAEIKDYYEIFQNHAGYAIYIEENFRGLGKSKELIYLMFCYLRELNITDVLVRGITNEIAWKTYLSTGAVSVNYKTALYQDLDKLLSSDIFREFTNSRR